VLTLRSPFWSSWASYRNRATGPSPAYNHGRKLRKCAYDLKSLREPTVGTGGGFFGAQDAGRALPVEASCRMVVLGRLVLKA
jgi:hypothetical protein